jgi:hypothetical protein
MKILKSESGVLSMRRPWRAKSWGAEVASRTKQTPQAHATRQTRELYNSRELYTSLIHPRLEIRARRVRCVRVLEVERLRDASNHSTGRTARPTCARESRDDAQDPRKVEETTVSTRTDTTRVKTQKTCNVKKNGHAPDSRIAIVDVPPAISLGRTAVNSTAHRTCGCACTELYPHTYRVS